MAPATKRRRVAPSSFEPSRGVSVVSSTAIGKASITSFGRIGKSTATSNSVFVKEEAAKLAETDLNILNGLNKSNGSRSIKRKPEDDGLRPAFKAVKTEAGTVQIKVEADSENISPIPTITEIRSTTPEPTVKKPQNTRHLAVVEPDTPTKSARARLEALAIKSSPVKQETSPLGHSQSSSSPAFPTPCPKKRRRGADLPEPVQDLLNLHSAFLTALSLHYAHHGTATPVDVRQLSPSVAKVWGRRAISTDDVRRLLGVQQRSVDNPSQAALLSVWDYGRGKTCIEYCPPAESNGAKRAWGAGLARQPLESASLVKSFGVYVRDQYASFVASEGEEAESDEFVSSLPLARLHKRATSKAAKSKLVSKGQTRLTELKTGAITRHAKDASKDSLKSTTASSIASDLQQQQSSSNTKPLPPSQRSDSLLSRIRAKESLLASLPAGPTDSQLARRAALHRAPDVINVLTVLASNSGRSVASSISSVARSGMLPTSTPLSQRMGSVNLGGSDDDDALLAALGGSSSSSSYSSKATVAAAATNRGLSSMFGGSSPISLASSSSSTSFGSISSAASSAHVSMSMQQVVDRVQNSMRAPIARAEAEDVLRLIAAEIAPQWLQVREVGSVKAITIRGSLAAERSWRDRVDELLKTA